MEKTPLSRRDRRRLANLTLIEVANLIGISESQLHHWEKGTRSFSADQEKTWDKALTRLERMAKS